MELWDFSLVDPDNRRPVDYAVRREHLECVAREVDPAELLANWRDGRIKMFVTRTLLGLRREHAALFDSGTYERLETHGAHAERCFCFMRKHEDMALLVVVPRLSSTLGFPPIGSRWKDTTVGARRPGGTWRNIFTGAEHSGDTDPPVSKLLGEFPVAALLIR